MFSSVRSAYLQATGREDIRSRIVSLYEFACHDASCRPPTSGGTGGSDPSGGGHGSAPSPAKVSARAFGNQLKKAGLDVASVTKATSRSWKVKMSNGTTHTVSSGSDLGKLHGASPKKADAPKPVAAPKKAEAAATKPEPKAPSAPAQKSGQLIDVDVLANAITKRFDDNDSFAGFRELLRASGADSAKPRVVSAQELAKLNKQDPSGMVARSAPTKATEKFISGDSHADLMRKGASEYGEGSYFAAGAKAKSHVETNYDQGGYSTIVGHLDRSEVPMAYKIGGLITLAMRRAEGSTKDTYYVASVDKHIPCTPDELRRVDHVAAAIRKATIPPDAEGDLRMSNVFGDSAVQALMLGYKGYEIPSPRLDHRSTKGITYVALVDRSAISVAG